MRDERAALFLRGSAPPLSCRPMTPDEIKAYLLEVFSGRFSKQGNAVIIDIEQVAEPKRAEVTAWVESEGGSRQDLTFSPHSLGPCLVIPHSALF
jgi:hypothetical protein